MAALALACQAEPRRASLVLRPPQAFGCEPTRVTEVLLTPRGDFPSEDRPSVRLDLEAGPTEIDLFPSDTELISVFASGFVQTGVDIDLWTGGGVAILDEERPEIAIPVLPLRRSCALSDVLRARALVGSSVLALDDGRLLVAGGERPELGVSDSIVTVRPGDRLAEDGGHRLFVPRTGATATALLEGLVLIAGGSASEGGSPLPNFEVFRVHGDGEVPDAGFLATPRVQHGATRLPDGRVLLVGGLSAAGPIDSAEILEVVGSTVQAGETRTRLLHARARPFVTTLDDGTVLVAGGGVPEIERFDVDTESFESVGVFDGVRPDAAFARLAGSRIARVGGRIDDAWSREVEVVLSDGRQVLSLGEVLVPMEAPTATGLDDGRLLVVGRDPVAERPVAQIIDPGGTRDERERALEPVVPSRAATHLVPLADGSIAEADPDGVSLLRLAVETALDRSGANIFPVQTNQNHQLSFDVAEHWRADGDLLSAEVDGARIDLPLSRFAEVDVELETRGPFELLLLRDQAEPASVGIGRDQACAVSVSSDELVETRIRRSASGVTIEGPGGSVPCSFELPDRIGLAIRAARGAGVRRFSVLRR